MKNYLCRDRIAGQFAARHIDTCEQFVEYGLDGHSITRAIRELSALGITEVTKKDRAGNAQFRNPNLFRLTYRPVGRAEPTHEWRRVKTIDEAKAIARAAHLDQGRALRRTVRRQTADASAAESV
jgi:hypothetical protein